MKDELVSLFVLLLVFWFAIALIDVFFLGDIGKKYDEYKQCVIDNAKEYSGGVKEYCRAGGGNS